MRRYKGLYVEDFPEPAAGAPILDKHRLPPDLEAYMRRCGPLADPDHFEVAELLMTSGMTNANKDRHLRSKKVSTTFEAMCEVKANKRKLIQNKITHSTRTRHPGHIAMQ
jgi:hypothetical protein